MHGKATLIIAVALILTPMALCLGISQDYYEDKIVPVERGTTHLHRINIQNEKGEYVRVNLSVGGTYCFLGSDERSKIISIPAKSYDTYEYINITIPPDETDGNIISCKYSVTPISDKEGQVVMVYKINDNFKVRIMKPKGPIQLITGLVSKGSESLLRGLKSKYSIGALVVITLAILAVALYRQGLILAKKATTSREHHYTHKHHSPSTDSIKVIPRASPENAFRTAYGSATTTGELAVLVNKMREEELRPYIERNDFARWAHYVTKNEEYASKIARARNKQEVIKALLGM